MSTPSQKLPRIFISYSRWDEEFGARLAHDLRFVFNDESAVWYDQNGWSCEREKWWEQVTEELDTRDACLLVLSPNAIRSSWMRRVLDEAHRHEGLQLIPVLYRSCEIWTDLEAVEPISFLPPRKYDAAFDEILMVLDLPTQYELWKTKEEYMLDGMLHRRARRYKLALAAFNRALSFDAHDAFLYGQRADVYRLLEEYELALQDFERAFALDPTVATSWAYTTRGQVYDGLGLYDLALADFERAYYWAASDPVLNKCRDETKAKLAKTQKK